MTKIAEITYAFPKIVQTNEILEKEIIGFSGNRTFAKTGIKSRNICGANENSFSLALEACRNLFVGNPGLTNAIDIVIYCTQNPIYTIPGDVFVLIDHFQLKKNICCFNLSLACSGFCYSMSIADSLIKNGVGKKALIVTTESYSKNLDPIDKTTRAVFGDGAACTVLESTSANHIGVFYFESDGAGVENLYLKNLKTESNNFLLMNGPEIFKYTLDSIPKTVDKILQINALHLDQIDYFVFHQANRFMLEHLREKIGINMERFIFDLEITGNVVSASIPFAFQGLRDSKKLKEGDKIMFLGFGAGYSLAGTVYTV
jgi:3-oxoacyl-[acyl-carrier-protein] synthase-3